MDDDGTGRGRATRVRARSGRVNRRRRDVDARRFVVTMEERSKTRSERSCAEIKRIPRKTREKVDNLAPICRPPTARSARPKATRRTVGRALRDARAISAGGGPDRPRAKRPEPRVSRLSSSRSRAIRQVPRLPRRATVIGPVPVSPFFLSQSSAIRRRAERSRDEPLTHRASSATRRHSRKPSP